MELFLPQKEDEIRLVEMCETFEGEYPFVGDYITMIRFPNCNLACPWCDTEFSKVNVVTSSSEIISSLHRTNKLMITGGEPGLHSSKIYKLLVDILSSDVYLSKIFVQTNGLMFRSSTDKKLKEEFSFDNFYYIWSPKFYDDLTEKQSLNWLLVLEKYVDLSSVYIKLVYDTSTHDTLELFVEKVKTLYGSYLLSRCSVMPLTSEDNKLGNYEETMNFCYKHNLNFSPRMHLIYSTK